MVVAGLLGEDKSVNIQPTPLFGSWRLVLAIVGFFMFFHLYAQRVGMSVAIVSMVNQTAIRQLQLEAAALEKVQQNASNYSLPVSAVTGDQQCVRQEANGTIPRRVCTKLDHLYLITERTAHCLTVFLPIADCVIVFTVNKV